MALRDNTTHANRSETAIEGATPKIIQVTGGRAVLPDAAFLTTAEYKRLGADLLLEDNQGARVLVQDYFDSDVPADLISSDGAAIPGDLAVRLAGTLAPGQYAQAGRSASAGQPIGNIETVSGQVQVTHADGSKALLTKGAAVFQGDVLQTPQGASVGILFVDKTSLSLGANGRMVLDQLVFDPSAQTGKSAFSLVSGTFSFVSGQIAKSEPDAMVVRTPVATMGIRGTLGTGGYSAQTGLTAAILPEGGQTVGEMSITNGSGTQVINQPNTGLQVASFFTPPSAPVTVTPGFMAANFGSVLSALPPTPISPAAVSTVQQTIASTPPGSPNSGPGMAGGMGMAGMGGPVAPQGPQGPGAQGPSPQGAATGPGSPGPEAGMGMTGMGMGGAGGAPQAAFAAAAQAAMNAAIAQGATIEQAQQAALQVQQAFQNALAGGASPQQALLAAGQAAAQVGLLGPGAGGGMGGMGMGGVGGANPFAIVAAGGTVAPVSSLTGTAVPPASPGGGMGAGAPGAGIGMAAAIGMAGGLAETGGRAGPGGPGSPGGPGGGDPAATSTVATFATSAGIVPGFSTPPTGTGLSSTGLRDLTGIAGLTGVGATSTFGPTGSLPGFGSTSGLPGSESAFFTLTAGTTTGPRTDVLGTSTTPQTASSSVSSSTSTIGPTGDTTPDPTLPSPTETSALHAAQGTDVFLGGSYIQLGISQGGALGSASGAPSGFHPSGSYSGKISMVANSHGYANSGDGSGDYAFPGSSVDNFVLGWEGSSSAYSRLGGSSNFSSVTTADDSTSTHLKATTTGTVTGVLAFTQVIEFDPADGYYKVTISVQNTSGTALSDVRVMHNTDPDHNYDTFSTFSTYDDVADQAGSGGMMVVDSQGATNHAHLTWISGDPLARGSTTGFDNIDVFNSNYYESPVDSDGSLHDNGINLVTRFATIAAGDTVSTTYYTSINAATVGNDFLTGTGIADILNANAGNDRLYGLGGNDVLKGGSGNDTLAGGAGTDSLTGGTGEDIFRFGFGHGATLADRLADLGVDTITDFVHGVDKIDLVRETFGLSASDTVALVTATVAPGGTPTDLGATNNAVVVVGASRGGVDLYFTTNAGASDNSNSYQIAHLDSVSTSDVTSADIRLSDAIVV